MILHVFRNFEGIDQFDYYDVACSQEFWLFEGSAMNLKNHKKKRKMIKFDEASPMEDRRLERPGIWFIVQSCELSRLSEVFQWDDAPRCLSPGPASATLWFSPPSLMSEASNLRLVSCLIRLSECSVHVPCRSDSVWFGICWQMMLNWTTIGPLCYFWVQLQFDPVDSFLIGLAVAFSGIVMMNIMLMFCLCPISVPIDARVPLHWRLWINLI